MRSEANQILFAVDLEDVRDWVREGERFSPRVPVNTERFLRFLESKNGKGTFFVVGKVAERYGGLIADILAEGHEIACHSHEHLQLEKLGQKKFREDLKRNMEALYRCGATHIKGFRAPTFSMTESTQWAYEILEDLGFSYSSSVLPARNPLYGWPGFGEKPRKIGNVFELPVTLGKYPFLQAPLAGGVYFRTVPFPLIRRETEKIFRSGKPVLTYFHPYDIDTGQERFMHPDLNNNRWMNALMYVNRSKVFPRIEKLIDFFSCSLITYNEYVERTLKNHIAA